MTAVLAVSLSPSTLASAEATLLRTKAVKPKSISVITYNVGDGLNEIVRRDLRRLMRLKPAVIALQEVADRDGDDGKPVRRAAAQAGYKLYYESGRRAEKHNALLVRKGFQVTAHGAFMLHPGAIINGHTPGSMPDGRFDPRFVNWVRVMVNGKVWKVGTVHFVPSATRNGAAWEPNRKVFRKEIAGARKWWSQGAGEPILVGDFNATVDFDPLARFRSQGATPVRLNAGTHGNRKIDYIWRRGSTTNKTTGVVLGLGGKRDRDYRSDHRPVFAVITAKAAK